MKDHPIIFSAPMVLALLDGRKTMTRRLAWSFFDVNDNHTKKPTPWQRVQDGDRIWVRENFWACGFWRQTGSSMNPRYSFVRDASHAIAFDADSDMRTFEKGKFAQAEPAWHHRPNIFLPREESRLTLIVTATKIERLQDISEADAANEGVDRNHAMKWPDGDPGTIHDTRRRNFCALWRSLHGDGAWVENPEVVCITFRAITENIDQVSI